MKLALKVDVDTYRGTLEGVPRLLEVLRRNHCGATFLFSLGPDHTGRAIKRVFRKGFAAKVARTSVLQHYGIKTMLYGTLLPAPDIGRAGADIMRRVRDEGFEVGIHSWDHVKWQDGVVNADAQWTERQLTLAARRFQQIFGVAPRVHGAAGWQMNIHAYRLTQRLGYHYCSDTRGVAPFIPIYNAEIIACPQLPTTLPTLDELIGIDGHSAANAADHILGLTRSAPPSGHVYTLHAELEGGKFASIFERLLVEWRATGYDLTSLQDYYAALPLGPLPHHLVTRGAVPGRSGFLAWQDREFLAESAA